jgi:hypothetical protein
LDGDSGDVRLVVAEVSVDVIDRKGQREAEPGSVVAAEGAKVGAAYLSERPAKKMWLGPARSRWTADEQVVSRQAPVV